MPNGIHKYTMAGNLTLELSVISEQSTSVKSQLTATRFAEEFPVFRRWLHGCLCPGTDALTHIPHILYGLVVSHRTHPTWQVQLVCAPERKTAYLNATSFHSQALCASELESLGSHPNPLGVPS